MTSNFKLIDGIPGWGQGVLVVTAELTDSAILFTKTVVKNSPVCTLPLERITGTDVYTEKELIEKSKSVVGRAAVGSLFGPVGSIVGAISGSGASKRIKSHLYYTISFTSKDGTPAMITLECGVMGCHLSDFNKCLCQKLAPASGDISL